MSGDPIKQDNPLMAASRGDYFIPEDRAWSSNKIKWMWIAIDAAIFVVFLLAAVMLAL